MSNVMETIKKKAALLGKNIVLPEGEETRNIQAAAKIVKAGIAKITVLGNPEKVKAVAAETNTCLCGKVNYYIKFVFCKKLVNECLVCNITLDKGEVGILL